MKNKSIILMTAILALFLAACGDDGSSSSANSGGTDFAFDVETLDDLPNCTAEHERDTAFVKDGKKIYVCEEGRWEYLRAVIDSVGTVDELSACTNAREGDSVLVVSRNAVYVCDDGRWEKSYGRILTAESSADFPACTDSRDGDKAYAASERTYYVCDDGKWEFSSRLRDSVSAEKELPNCTEKTEGDSAYIKADNTVRLCRSERWLVLGESVANRDSLKNCTSGREGARAFLENEGATLVCSDGKWYVFDVDDLLKGSSSSVSPTSSSDGGEKSSSSSSIVSSSSAVEESSSSEETSSSSLKIEASSSSVAESSSSSVASSSSFVSSSSAVASESSSSDGDAKKMYVDLGNTVYSANVAKKEVSIALVGMPDTSSLNYISIYFEPNMSGNYARELRVWSNSKKIYRTRQHMYANNRASVITVYKVDAHTFTAVKTLDTKSIDGGLNYYWSGWSSGRGHIKLVYDRVEKTFYLYAEDTYIGYGNVSVDPITIDKITIEREQPYGTNTCEVSNIRVAGFASLDAAKAWDGLAF